MINKMSTIDFGAVTPSNLSFYKKPNLGRKRESMPQIENMDEVIIHFSDKVGSGKGVKKLKKSISKLKPSQDEVSIDKLKKMQEDGYDWRNRMYLISRDNYLMDAHHAYAIGLEEEPDYQVTCYKVNLPAKELIKRCNLLKNTKNVDISDNLTKAFLQIIK